MHFIQVAISHESFKNLVFKAFDIACCKNCRRGAEPDRVSLLSGREILLHKTTQKRKGMDTKMRVVVVDGQGGGLGRSLIELLKEERLDGVEIVGAATNAAAAAAMLKAGAAAAATGENAICWNCAHADIIAGPIGIIAANSMLGEISPAMAMAVSESEADKVLIPIARCKVHVAGLEEKAMALYIEDAVRMIRNLAEAGRA